ncbi:MAG: pentapeptide repeat-containing protein [Lentisphaeria bacterium]
MYCENERYKQEDFSKKLLKYREYENCNFLDCNFSNSDISGIKFIDCVFENCNMSMVKLKNTELNHVQFKGNKMFGLHFDDCNDFLLSMSFANCQLNYSSFFGLKIKNTTFAKTCLHDVDFTGADLSKSVFSNCDFTNATFSKTNVEGVNFATSYGYALDPEQNQIRKAKFDLQGVLGLLTKYDIVVK